MTAVTWFVASTNQHHSAISIPHFTFRIPQFRILPTAKVWAMGKKRECGSAGYGCDNG